MNSRKNELIWGITLTIPEKKSNSFANRVSCVGVLSL